MKVIEVSFEVVDFEVDIDRETTSYIPDWSSDVIEWLKLNGPYEVNEIDSLIKMVMEFKPSDDYSIGYYGIRETWGIRLMCGPRNMLFLTDDTMVEYFLDLLEGMKDEMKVRELN